MCFGNSSGITPAFEKAPDFARLLNLNRFDGKCNNQQPIRAFQFETQRNAELTEASVNSSGLSLCFASHTMPLSDGFPIFVFFTFGTKP